MLYEASFFWTICPLKEEKRKDRIIIEMRQFETNMRQTVLKHMIQ